MPGVYGPPIPSPCSLRCWLPPPVPVVSGHLPLFHPTSSALGCRCSHPLSRRCFLFDAAALPGLDARRRPGHGPPSAGRGAPSRGFPGGGGGGDRRPPCAAGRLPLPAGCSGRRRAPPPPATPPPAAATHLPTWLAAHASSLSPPICNALLADGDLVVMVVGGPNARSDFHVEAGDEWFYQLAGTLTLHTVDADGRHGAVTLGPGDTYALPGGVPHSPRRSAGSVGLVVERRRRPGERDALRWYCGAGGVPGGCGAVVHEEVFVCGDLAADLPPLVRGYWADKAKRTCGGCGWVEVPWGGGGEGEGG